MSRVAIDGSCGGFGPSSIILHLGTDENGGFTELTDYSVMFFPHEGETIKRVWRYDEVHGTAKRGASVLFDSRGLHRSNVPKSGERQLLSSYRTMDAAGL